MNLELQDGKFTLIDFPASVNDHGKALEMLGGLDHIAECLEDSSKRMELKFRPKDTFCKAAFGDSVDTCCLVMKVKTPMNAESFSEEEISAEILGVADSKYTFKSMADFQYLPVERKEDGSVVTFHDDIVPDKKELIPPDWLDKDVPMFVLPPAFSNSDRPAEYGYRDKLSLKEQKQFAEMHKEGSTAILIDRKKRLIYSQFMYFQDTLVPTQPLAGALKLYKEREKGFEDDALDKIKQAFEERPLWTKQGLQLYLNLSILTVKVCLPVCSYYWETGPWRAEWCKFGYDPRTDPNARKYQLLDFRTKKPEVATKRSALMFGRSNRGTVHATLQHGHLTSNSNKGLEIKKEKDLEWQFHPGCLPRQRVTFYHLCDVHLPIVEEALASELPQVEEQVCSEKYGWLPEGFIDEVRQLMVQVLKDTISKLEDEKLESGESSSAVVKQIKKEYVPLQTPVTLDFNTEMTGSDDAGDADTSAEKDDSDSELQLQRDMFAEDSLMLAGVDMDTSFGSGLDDPELDDLDNTDPDDQELVDPDPDWADPDQDLDEEDLDNSDEDFG